MIIPQGVTSSEKSPGWCWDHSYVRLPEMLFARTHPTPVRQPSLVVLNRALAVSLGLEVEVLERADSAGIYTGNVLPEGAEPIAQAYAGHQFGNFTNLGDGRAILLGEHLMPDGRRFDIQLKGPGRTPFSRGGDGRAALGPMLREYIISEAMHGLGIPTTRSLAVAATGEIVHRSEPLPGAVLMRVAASHIRVGTFQYAAANEDHAALQALAEHTRRRHFPELAEAGDYEFFLAVMERQAELIAKWLHVGFIHGVMNTDNMALSGETIDYGPCAFMDVYDPATVFSSIDRAGRYAYGKQPDIARWNLARLAEAMLPLFHADERRAVDMANEALGGFEGRFQAHWLAGMRAKLGLVTAEEMDAELVGNFLEWLHREKMDFTNSFRTLSDEAALRVPSFPDADFIEWHGRWQERLACQPVGFLEIAEGMRRSNPAVIPRNHKVEEALAAAERGDLAVMERLLVVLERPFEIGVLDEYLEPPLGGVRYETFCGT